MVFEFVKPKIVDEYIIMLNLDISYDQKFIDDNYKTWLAYASGFASAIEGKLGIKIPISMQVSTLIDDKYPNGRISIIISSWSSSIDDDKFRSAIKDYADLLIQSLQCTSAKINITTTKQYLYNA